LTETRLLSRVSVFLKNIFLSPVTFQPLHPIYYYMNPSEYNQCVQELADSLYRFAWKSIGDGEEAKDVVQQAFEVLWEKRADVLPEKGKSFLFTVTHRKCMDVHRNRGRTSGAESIPEHTLSEHPRTHDLKQILQQALTLLDEQSRNLVLLKDYEGYSYEEIAQVTLLNTTQVKVYLHRARKVLRNYLVSREHVI
jgi:RNA polymerase sigma factor (sigma-70 family)